MVEPPHQQPNEWGRRVSRLLGTLEVLLGLGLLYGGCRYGWLTDDSAANIFGTYAILTGLFALLIPGLCLYGRTGARWLSQVIPALFLVMYVLVVFLAESPS